MPSNLSYFWEFSDSEREEHPYSSSFDIEKPRGSMNGRDIKDVSEYEKQRLSRIAENKKRMEALGLAKLATSFMDSASNLRKIDRKGKRKLGEDHDAADEDYKPCKDSSSSEDDDSEERDEDLGSGKASGSRGMKFTSPMQMNEDELIMNFYCFDESWKGSITVSDLKRVAAAHDFIWSDNELRDMIDFFDSAGDGKLSLDDFRRIAVRCNMIKESIT